MKRGLKVGMKLLLREEILILDSMKRGLKAWRGALEVEAVIPSMKRGLKGFITSASEPGLWIALDEKRIERNISSSLMFSRCLLSLDEKRIER